MRRTLRKMETAADNLGTESSSVQLDPGIYTNIFPVTLPDAPAYIWAASRAEHFDLRTLRERIERKEWDIQR